MSYQQHFHNSLELLLRLALQQTTYLHIQFVET